MREALKMILVLSLISAGAGALLATVKQFTQPKIEEQVLTYVQGPALASVLPEHDNDPIRERATVVGANGDHVTVFPAREGGELSGVAFEVFGKGYGGEIGVMVGFDAREDRLTGIGVTTHKETPGVGSRVALDSFTGQFVRHPFSGLSLKAEGGDIAAVSGATISSTGVTRAVHGAIDWYRANRDDIRAAVGQGSS